MPSAQECAERLREQAYRTLLPQIRDLEKELQNVSNSLSTGIQQLGQKLESLSHIELPTTEVVLNEILGDVSRETDLNTNSLVLFAHTLRQKETQEEILALLLDAAHRFFPITALFAVRGSRYVGWSSRGCSEDVSRSLSSSAFLRSDCPKFDSILEGGTAVQTADLIADCPPLEFMRQDVPGFSKLVPLRVLDRPVAILIAGGTEATQNSIDALSILAEFTVLRLENISLRILYELTAAKRESDIPVQAEPAPLSVPEPTPVLASFQAAAAQAEPAPKPAPVFDPEALKKTARAAEAVTGAEEVAFAPAAEQPHPEPVILEQETSKLFQESRPLVEEEELHSKAKRFARLLVQEIKLYNEHHVVEGRENKDLYIRLKKEIDRSRDMYETRVSPNVSRKIDYFHDEIIRILGDNDPSTLGSDYPGPRVES